MHHSLQNSCFKAQNAHILHNSILQCSLTLTINSPACLLLLLTCNLKIICARLTDTVGTRRDLRCPSVHFSATLFHQRLIFQGLTLQTNSVKVLRRRRRKKKPCMDGDQHHMSPASGLFAGSFVLMSQVSAHCGREEEESSSAPNICQPTASIINAKHTSNPSERVRDERSFTRDTTLTLFRKEEPLLNHTLKVSPSTCSSRKEFVQLMVEHFGDAKSH